MGSELAKYNRRTKLAIVALVAIGSFWMMLGNPLFWLGKKLTGSSKPFMQRLGVRCIRGVMWISEKGKRIGDAVFSIAERAGKRGQ